MKSKALADYDPALVANMVKRFGLDFADLEDQPIADLFKAKLDGDEYIQRLQDGIRNLSQLVS